MLNANWDAIRAQSMLELCDRARLKRVDWEARQECSFNRAKADWMAKHGGVEPPQDKQLDWMDPIDKWTHNIGKRMTAAEVEAMLKDNVTAAGVAMAEQRLQAVCDADFAAGDYKHNYLIQNVLIEGQPMMISGIKKALKTSTIVDMAASLATGKPFLGHYRFQVPQAVPVGVYSGESGKATLQDTRRRVYEAKKIGGAQIFWCFEVPQFDSQMDIAAIVKNITDNKLKVVIFDPLYLSMAGIGDGASNMFKVGALLRPIAEACIKADATPIFVHHNTKANSKNYEPPELEDMAWAGFAEFARQWLLIGRRELYETRSNIGAAGWVEGWRIGRRPVPGIRQAGPGRRLAHTLAPANRHPSPQTWAVERHALLSALAARWCASRAPGGSQSLRSPVRASESPRSAQGMPNCLPSCASTSPVEPRHLPGRLPVANSLQPRSCKELAGLRLSIMDSRSRLNAPSAAR